MFYLQNFEALGSGAFDDQVAVTTAQMQGRVYESGVINQLVAARGWLGPFISSREGPSSSCHRFADLRALLGHLVGVAEKVGDIDAASLVVRGLSEHVEELKTWFAVESRSGGSQAMLARISSLIERAHFVSYPRAAPGGERLVLVGDVGLANSAPTVLGADVLTEMIRGAVLSRADIDAPEQRDALDGFVASYYAAVDVHASRLRLEAAFHPQFCRGEVEALSPQGINVSRRE